MLNQDYLNALKTIQQDYFLLHNSIICQIENNIEFFNFTGQDLFFRKKNKSLYIHNQDIFKLIEDTWNDYRPMHLESISPRKTINSIYEHFLKLDGINVNDRFKFYEKTLTDIVEKYNLETKVIIQPLCNYWKGIDNSDLNKFKDKTIYDLPFYINNQDMSLKYNKYNLDTVYQDIFLDLQYKIISDFLVNFEVKSIPILPKLLSENKLSIDKEYFIKNVSFFKDSYSESLPYGFDMYDTLKEYSIFNRLPEIINSNKEERFELYLKILSNYNNSTSKILEDNFMVKLIEKQKDIISENINFLENEDNKFIKRL